MTCWFVLAGAEICALAGRLRHQRPSASLTAGHLSRLARTYHGLSTPEPGLTGHNLSIIRDKSSPSMISGPALTPRPPGHRTRALMLRTSLIKVGSDKVTCGSPADHGKEYWPTP